VQVRKDETHRTASLRLRPEPTSARAARRFVASTLARWEWHGSLDDVVLLTSELVANGVTHAVSPLTLTVTGDAGRVRVALTDQSSARPVVRSLQPEAERGRGLALVAALARRWGVERADADGKVVWFEVSGG
jgi:anti-sigma regulatory factor (Ser/Thr protein kinase)